MARVAFLLCVDFCVKGACRNYCIACLHPLTRR
ncbi:DUF3265 domain-containing protein [Vibrio parahaemolyticus]|nr:DUF3265 domain-containing protein [Vibrio parahaemolyticus]